MEAYLHPPSVPIEGTSLTGIPDRDASPSVIPWFRNTFEVTPQVNDGNNTIWIFTFNSPSLIGVACTFEGSLPPEGGTGIVWWTFWNDNYNSALVPRDIVRFRPVACSDTMYLNSADLYNQGKVFSAQFVPGRQDFPARGAVVPGSGSKELDITETGGQNLTTSTLLQVSRKSYAGLAKDGCYLPYAAHGPEVLYEVPAVDGAIRTGTVSNSIVYKNRIKVNFRTVGGNTLGVYLYANDYGDELRVVYDDEEVPSDLGSGNIVLSHQNFHYGVTCFQGLLKQESVMVKSIRCFECQASPGASWTPFTTMGAEPDLPALDECARVRYHMQDAYPAASNDWGSVWRGIKSLAPTLKKVWNVAKPTIKTSLNALPYGGFINQGIDILENTIRTPSKAALRKKKLIERGERMEAVAEQRIQNPARQPLRPQRVLDVPGTGRSAGARRRRRMKEREAIDNELRLLGLEP
jgi:hypothetical protein